MDVGTLIVICIAWNTMGAIICESIGELVFNANGWEICNPYWCHCLSQSLNWFGALLVSLLYNALCPIGSLCYWISWMCTVKRRTGESDYGTDDFCPKCGAVMKKVM